MKNLMTVSLNDIMGNNVLLPITLKMGLNNEFDFSEIDKNEQISIINLVRILGTEYIAYLLKANKNDRLKSLFICDAIDVLKLDYKKEKLDNYEFLKDVVNNLKNIVLDKKIDLDKLDQLYKSVEVEYYNINKDTNPISKEILFCFLLAIQYVNSPNYLEGNCKSKMALDRICRNFYLKNEGVSSKMSLISLLKRNSQYQN